MQKPSVSTSIPIIIIISIIAGGLYFLFKPQDDSIREIHSSQLTTPESTQQIVTAPSTSTEVSTLQDNTQPQPEDYRRAPMVVTITDPCLEAIKELDSFFIYLDTQDYIREYQFPTGSKDFVASMVNKALSHPPAPNVKKDIINQVKTGAHLYRVLGGQNLLILAKILINEPDQLENIFGSFFDWSLMAGQCPNRTYAIRPQLNQLYDYARFFIDSEGGRSYISRRDTMTGLLTRFYAVQVIKEAQTHHIDKYNTELTPHITSLITDIESSDLLEKKETYLKKLYSFRDM